MKATELREKTVDELMQKEKELAEQLFVLRLRTPRAVSRSRRRSCRRGVTWRGS